MSEHNPWQRFTEQRTATESRAFDYAAVQKTRGDFT